MTKDIKQNKPNIKVSKRFSGPKVFFYDTQQELKKVSWPDRKTVLSATTVIIIIMIVVTVFTTIIDATFSKIFFWLKAVG